MSSYFRIDFNDPPEEYFPLPYQERLEGKKAGEVRWTDRPLRQGEHTGKVYWDVYINAIIQKALRDRRTHDGDYLWSGGCVLYFPAGKYHLNGDIFIYDTDPTSKYYGRCWSNVNFRGEDTATKFLGENDARAIWMTGYCGGDRRESGAGAWMRSFWSQDLDICFGVYDEDFERMHGAGPADPDATHGIWSFYIDGLYVHTGGIRVKRLSADIAISSCTFDYGQRSIEILDHVYSISIQNNQFWNTGQRVRIVHDTRKFDWQSYFSAFAPNQREGYRRGGMVIISGNRDNSPGTSLLPEDEGAIHIENCDEVIFNNNYSQDTRQPIDIPPGDDENYGGRLSDCCNFCNGHALTLRGCRYVTVANNIFGSYWPTRGGVVTLEDTHFASVTGNIITPIGGMNREKQQLSEEALSELPESRAVYVAPDCTHVLVSGNVVETVGPFGE